MDNRLLDVILKNVETLKYDTDTKLDKLEEKIGKLESKLEEQNYLMNSKVDQLLRFKYEVVAGSVVVSVVFSLAYQLMLSYLQKG
jgi:hypothetical protein